MNQQESNTHFKIKTRPRPGGQNPQRFPHHQGHDFPPIPTRGQPRYPQQFQPPQSNNDAPVIPLRQAQHPQQYDPHQADQETRHLPPRHDYFPHHHVDGQERLSLSDPHSHQVPRYNDQSAENIPHSKDEQQQHTKHKFYPDDDHHRQERGRPHSILRHKPQGPRVPPARETRPLTWFLAICCTIFWLLIIVGGLIILIIYLIYHPETPHFQITTFTLNSVYLDNGNLLNADIRILANFNNSNRKVTVDFSYLTIDLYYGQTRIGTQYIEPFYESNSVSTFVDIHMVTSQLRLPFRDISRLAAQVQKNHIQFEVKGAFRTRSNLGSLMHYSYWLHTHCTVVVTSPPSGALLWRKCRTKRY
ncbi:hypothetical protein QQ045_016503 [Rhodiola kirilowii]